MNQLEDFPSRSTDKLRYADTDRQGHVNNAVFATFLETGRTELLAQTGIFDRPQLSFVIARVTIDYRREIIWPGTVDCGTAIKTIGNSSVTVSQALFKDGILVATAESVLVQIDGATHRATPLDDQLKARLADLVLPV